MREVGKLEKSTTDTLKRAGSFPLHMIWEGLLVGTVGGLIVMCYRIVLTYAAEWLNWIISYVQGNPLRIAGWFGVLLLLALIVSALVKWEPFISGSGIPQIEGEMTGKLEQKWWKVLPAKFIGGFLCLLGGLSLGREGPSIQLGAMAGKGISRILKRGKTEEKYLLTCGASAGLSAAFHAPLAGIMFSLEEIHKGFSVSILISLMTASISADYISSHFVGLEPVFDFTIPKVLPHGYYWMLLLLGVVLGVGGVFYNWFTLKMKEWMQKPRWSSVQVRLIGAFLLAGILSLIFPQILGSGHELIVGVTSGEFTLQMILLLLVTKFLFSTVSFGSGAPGGIFFPLLVLGSLVGGAFAYIGVEFFGLDPIYVNSFVLLAMAGNFTAIVRAPITGIILIFEMSGSVSQMLSLSVVSIVAYVVATALKSQPIYESLLDALVHNKDTEPEQPGEKILHTFTVMAGCALDGKLVKEIEWPKNCLLVAVRRGSEELIPRGKTRLQAGDELTTISAARDSAKLHDKMEKLCYTSF